MSYNTKKHFGYNVTRCYVPDHLFHVIHRSVHRWCCVAPFGCAVLCGMSVLMMQTRYGRQSSMICMLGIGKIQRYQPNHAIYVFSRFGFWPDHTQTLIHFCLYVNISAIIPQNKKSIFSERPYGAPMCATLFVWSIGCTAYYYCIYWHTKNVYLRIDIVRFSRS